MSSKRDQNAFCEHNETKISKAPGKLKPCPFCGSIPRRNRFHPHAVKCVSDRCLRAQILIDGSVHEDFWNGMSREDPAAVFAMRAQLTLYAAALEAIANIPSDMHCGAEAADAAVTIAKDVLTSSTGWEKKNGKWVRKTVVQPGGLEPPTSSV